MVSAIPTIAGISPSKQRADGCVDGGSQDAYLLQNLAPLPETRTELAQISSSLGASPDHLHFGQAASEQMLKNRQDLSDYRVIAFATHAILTSQLDCLAEPALVLTAPDQASDVDNGLLTTSDIVELRLDADWILLSACNTGGPDGRLGGESLTGLARAFFYAGARTLMVTHWTVASDATVDLTTKTFDAFATGTVGKAEALRQAQIAMINGPSAANSHPALWAPFTIVGDGGRRSLSL